MPPEVARAPGGPLPVMLVGGWLGAGKTTWINRLLREAGGRRLAVLVNDFGSVNIDAEWLAAEGSMAEAGIVPLTGGCLCCSFGDDLPGTLRRLACREPRPDLAVVELSGVARPSAVRGSLVLAPGTQATGTWVLADAAAIRRQASDPYVGDTVREQLAAADRLLINKADRVSADALESLRRWAQGAAPGARIALGQVDELPLPWSAGEPAVAARAPGRSSGAPPSLAPALEAPPAAEAPLSRTAPLEPATSGPLGLERGRLAPPAPPACLRVARASATLPPDIDLDALGGRLGAEPDVLRAKGLLTDRGGRAWLLQVTPGVHERRPLRSAQRPAGRLVIVTRPGSWSDGRLQALVDALAAADDTIDHRSSVPEPLARSLLP